MGCHLTQHTAVGRAGRAPDCGCRASSPKAVTLSTTGFQELLLLDHLCAGKSWLGLQRCTHINVWVDTPD
jgi:hypothetical protein